MKRYGEIIIADLKYQNNKYIYNSYILIKRNAIFI